MLNKEINMGNEFKKVTLEDFPQFVYEKEIDRHDRYDKRQKLIIVLLIILLFASHIFWACIFNSYETVAYTQDSQGQNNINVNGEQGDMYYEPDSSYTEEEETQD